MSPQHGIPSRPTSPADLKPHTDRIPSPSRPASPLPAVPPTVLSAVPSPPPPPPPSCPVPLPPHTLPSTPWPRGMMLSPATVTSPRVPHFTSSTDSVERFRCRDLTRTPPPPPLGRLHGTRPNALLAKGLPPTSPPVPDTLRPYGFGGPDTLLGVSPRGAEAV
eukprot:Sspe_Gene.19821::Locus_7243_Transcript_1_2_Confidence_0.500_Length_540::g.19821::m.19821